MTRDYGKALAGLPKPWKQMTDDERKDAIAVIKMVLDDATRSLSAEIEKVFSQAGVPASTHLHLEISFEDPKIGEWWDAAPSTDTHADPG